MSGLNPQSRRMSVKALYFLAFASVAVSGCATSAEPRYGRLDKDARTCSRFGAQYGTAAYSDCMLAQQRRRDLKQLESLERTRLTSQIAKDGQIMAERARQQRCDKNPNRRECGR